MAAVRGVQTTSTLTLTVDLPPGTTHAALRLLCRRQRLLLRSAAPGSTTEMVLLRRRLFGPVDPLRTPGYAINDGRLVVELHKATPGEWPSLFASDDSSPLGLQQPAGWCASASAGTHDAPSPFEANRHTERCCTALASTRNAWRAHACRRLLPSSREERACGLADEVGQPGGQRPSRVRGVYPAAEAREDGAAPSPAPVTADGEGEGEGEGEEAEDPLPGSLAGCDACGREVRRYHHCLRCGEDEGFDLCTGCYRTTALAEQHRERRGPSHVFQLVTPRSVRPAFPAAATPSVPPVLAAPLGTLSHVPPSAAGASGAAAAAAGARAEGARRGGGGGRAAGGGGATRAAAGAAGGAGGVQLDAAPRRGRGDGDAGAGRAQAGSHRRGEPRPASNAGGPPCRRPSGDRAGRHPRRLHRPPPAARRARCP